MFGSNETYGPVFLKYINSNTDPKIYKPNYMGNLVDNMFWVELADNKLTVSVPIDAVVNVIDGVVNVQAAPFHVAI